MSIGLLFESLVRMNAFDRNAEALFDSFEELERLREVKARVEKHDVEVESKPRAKVENDEALRAEGTGEHDALTEEP